MKVNNELTGSMTALITPLKNDRLDEVSYEALIRRQIANGIDVVVPVGTTGESATLTHEEHRRCIEIAVATCRGSATRVMAGAGSNATHEAVGLAKFAAECGADAILSVAPYYNKPTQEGLFAHYQAIARASELPLVLYNVPGRTGCEIAAATAIKLFNEVPNIYAIKEASGDMDKCVDLLAHAPELRVFSGEDAINYPVLASGGSGVISVSANLLPDMISQLCKAASERDYSGAKAINDKLYNVNKILFCESNPIPIKAAMFVAGLIPALEYRLPLCAPSAENLRKIEAVMKQYEIKGL